jgi:hypothetical protein
MNGNISYQSVGLVTENLWNPRAPSGRPCISLVLFVRLGLLSIQIGTPERIGYVQLLFLNVCATLRSESHVCPMPWPNSSADERNY